MSELLHEILFYGFIKNALIAGFLAGIACGITGTFVVIKKISHVSGGLSHAVLGGIGIALFLGIDPVYGALVFAVTAALIAGSAKHRSSQNEDTVIAALWSVGMAIGVIFAFLTPGYNKDLMSYLFGNILMVSNQNLIALGIMDIVIIAVFLMYYRQFIYISFDEEYSSLRGINVERVYILLLCMVALTVVMLIQIVGLILVIALITLPAAISGVFSRNLTKMTVAAVILSIVLTYSGLGISFHYNIPSGATIIVLAGLVYFLSLAIRKILRA